MYTRVVASLFLLAMVIAPIGAHAQGLTHNFLGLSPSTVGGDDLLRDQAFEKTVNLQRDLTDQPVTFETTFYGPDARFIRGPETVEFAVGQSQAKYTFEIYPEGAATGEYSAMIDFLPILTSESTNTGTGLQIRRGVTLKVAFSVTDEEVTRYEILHTNVRKTEEGIPFGFAYTVDNTGNVEWRPDTLLFRFTDIFTDAPKGEIEVDAVDLPFAPPSNISQLDIQVPHELEPGNYNIEIEFYDEGKIVSTDTATIIIFEEGALNQKAELVSLETNKLTYRPGENIKVTGTFSNTGDLATSGVMTVEVYSQTRELVEILTSDPQDVDPGEEVTIDEVFKLSEGGTYTLEAYVEYAGAKETKTLTAVIDVGDFVLGSTQNVIPYALIGLAVLVFILLVIYLVKKRGGRRTKPPGSIPPVPPSSPTSAQPLSTPPMAPSVAPQKPVPSAPPTQPVPPPPAPPALPEPPVSQQKPVVAPPQKPTPSVDVKEDATPGVSINPAPSPSAHKPQEQKSVPTSSPQPMIEAEQTTKSSETQQQIAPDDDDMWTISL